MQYHPTGSCLETTGSAQASPQSEREGFSNGGVVTVGNVRKTARQRKEKEDQLTADLA